MRFPSVPHIMLWVFDAWRFIQRAKQARSLAFLLSSSKQRRVRACDSGTSLGFRKKKGGEEEREEEAKKEKEREGERGREGREGEEENGMTRRVEKGREGQE